MLSPKKWEKNHSNMWNKIFRQESFSYRFVYLSIWLAQFRFFDIEYSFFKHQYTCIFDVRQIKFATGRPRLNSYRVLRWCTVRSRLPFPLITIIVIFGWCNWLNLLIFSIDLSWCGGSIKKTKWPEARAWRCFFLRSDWPFSIDNFFLLSLLFSSRSVGDRF